MDADGKVAVVTGGSSGIGQAVVRTLRNQGTRVAVLDLHAASGDGDVALKIDVSREDDVVAAVDEVRAELGRLDIAVLNAGTGGYAPLVEMSADEWDRVMAVNLRGVFLCLRETAKAMMEGGSGGAIVATGSISGFLADRGMAHYAVSKTGIAQLVRVAARELGPFGIRVNAVAPGTTDTPLFAQTKLLSGFWERLSERTALGGIGTAEEVAQVIMSLTQLDWVTGQVVAVDGGVSLWSPIDPTESMGTSS